jgi:glycosyltransferase involved in cell wall biosynthesis
MMTAKTNRSACGNRTGAGAKAGAGIKTGITHKAGTANKTSAANKTSRVNKTSITRAETKTGTGNKKLSLVILVHNSAATIEEVVRGFCTEVVSRLPGSEFIIAEDGSTDGTKEILAKLKKELPITLLQAKEKKGYFKALKDAVKAAKNEYLFLSDGDGEHNPRDFWKLYSKFMEIPGKYDIVVGYKTRRRPFYRAIVSLGNVFLDGMLFGLWLRGANCNFRLMRKKVMDEIIDDIGSLKYTPSVEALIRAKRKGYKIAEVPIRHIYVASGELAPSKIPKIMFREFWNLLKFRFSRETGKAEKPGTGSTENRSAAKQKEHQRGKSR